MRRLDGGQFLWTLMASDIATGWSESLPIVMRDGAVVLTALQLIRRQLPFPLRGIDVDNDPVFMNSLMEDWCDRPGQQMVLNRSRAYKSNGQAWVGHPMLGGCESLTLSVFFCSIGSVSKVQTCLEAFCRRVSPRPFARTS